VFVRLNDKDQEVPDAPRFIMKDGGSARLVNSVVIEIT